MTHWPKISIVTPAYNCGQLIRRCIESVIAQQYPNFEHIIVDGGSEDCTVNVLKQYPHLRWISEKDTGEANALNKGLQKVTGEIVCWLNADDYLHPDALIPVGKTFAENPEFELVFGNTHMVTPHGAILWEKNSSPNTSLKSLVRWWAHTTMPHQPSMFFKKNLLDRIGPINEHLHFSIDLELWLRCALQTNYHHINRVLSCAVQRPDCKSEGTATGQIQSHWNVLVPFLAHLSFAERVAFWSEYYIGRLNGLNCHAQLETTRFPDSEEALIGVVRALSSHDSSLGILSFLFQDQQAKSAVTELLASRGLSFKHNALFPVPDRELLEKRPVQKTIVIDGVFPEGPHNGIFRIWDSILKEWAATSFAQRVVVLDRGGYAPRHPGIRYRLVPRVQQELVKESEMLKTICEEENAGLFISTHYTSIEGIPSLMPVYDMIPEKTGFDLSAPAWVAKHRAIRRASAFFCISQSTRKDLLEVFPDIDAASTVVTYCGVDRDKFKPSERNDQRSLSKSLNLDRPYFILPGGRLPHKNTKMFFEAIQKLPTQHGFKVLVTGDFTETDLEGLTTGCEILTAKLSDDELRAAYSGALATVYPSSYEGFALPVLEAMACECPVICSPWTSLPEVGGSAVMYIKDAETLANALIEIQRPETRQILIAAGNEQVLKFRWNTMAGQIQDICEQVLRATDGRNQMNPML